MALSFKAHDFRSQSLDLANVSAKIFATHFGHLALVLAWISYSSMLPSFMARLLARADAPTCSSRHGDTPLSWLSLAFHIWAEKPITLSIVLSF